MGCSNPTTRCPLHTLKNNLIHFKCSHESWLYYCLKSGTKWFGINNRDGLFSTLLHIGHITSGSGIWPTCNIPTLFHIGIKRDHIVMWGGRGKGGGVLAPLKLTKLHTCWQVFRTGGMRGIPPATSQPKHFYFNFILFVHTGHTNCDFNQRSILTEYCY